jgi:hypothetical protein
VPQVIELTVVMLVVGLWVRDGFKDSYRSENEEGKKEW